MKISIEEKKAEAVLRMKLLGIFPETIRLFKNANIVSVCEPPYGAIFWANEDDLKLIKVFEQNHNALVYLVVRAYHKEFGKMDSFLFVSDYKDEEWKMDRNDLKYGQALAYVYNYDTPIFSEFGSIGIKLTPAAGLIRIW